MFVLARKIVRFAHVRILSFFSASLVPLLAQMGLVDQILQLAEAHPLSAKVLNATAKLIGMYVLIVDHHFLSRCASDAFGSLRANDAVWRTVTMPRQSRLF